MVALTGSWIFLILFGLDGPLARRCILLFLRGNLRGMRSRARPPPSLSLPSQRHLCNSALCRRPCGFRHWGGEDGCSVSGNGDHQSSSISNNRDDRPRQSLLHVSPSFLALLKMSALHCWWLGGLGAHHLRKSRERDKGVSQPTCQPGGYPGLIRESASALFYEWLAW